MDRRNQVNRESQHQRSYSQPENQSNTSPRRRRPYQQTPNRPSLNISLPLSPTLIPIRSGNLSPVGSVSSRTRTSPTPTFFDRTEERSPSPIENLRRFQRDYLTGVDPYNSDEETTYQPIAGSSRSNPDQNLIDFSEQLVVNYSQHNSEEEQEEEQDDQNNNQLPNNNLLR